MTLNIDFFSDWEAILRSELVKMGYVVPVGVDQRKVALLYFNATFRRFPEKPRKIWKPNGFQCPPDLVSGLTLLEGKVSNGDDLFPHLSRKVVKVDFDDALLNDWGIFHFHLGTTLLPNSPLVQGTKFVLFARVTDTDFYEIEVADHSNWARFDLIEILHANWPHTIEQFKAAEAKSLSQITDSAAISTLREGQGRKQGGKINAPVQTKDGTIYRQFGGGYATDGTSLRVVMEVNTATQLIRRLEKGVRKELPTISSELQKEGSAENATVNVKLEQDGARWVGRFPGFQYVLNFGQLKLT